MVTVCLEGSVSVVEDWVCRREWRFIDLRRVSCESLGVEELPWCGKQFCVVYWLISPQGETFPAHKFGVVGK